jgi:hypothetical protein
VRGERVAFQRWLMTRSVRSAVQGDIGRRRSHTTPLPNGIARLVSSGPTTVMSGAHSSSAETRRSSVMQPSSSATALRSRRKQAPTGNGQRRK